MRGQGGVANTYFGSKLTNKLSTESPRQFLEKLGEAAVRSRTGGKAPAASQGGALAGVVGGVGSGLSAAWSGASSLAASMHITPTSLVAVAGGYATLQMVRNSLRGNGGEGGNEDLAPSAL